MVRFWYFFYSNVDYILINNSLCSIHICKKYLYRLRKNIFITKIVNKKHKIKTSHTERTLYITQLCSVSRKSIIQSNKKMYMFCRINFYKRKTITKFSTQYLQAKLYHLLVITGNKRYRFFCPWILLWKSKSYNYIYFFKL